MSAYEGLEMYKLIHKINYMSLFGLRGLTIYQVLHPVIFENS